MDASGEQIYSGHRERLRDRTTYEGMRESDERSVLETILFYALPYKDVHPLSYRLMEKYGTLPAVLAAPEEELARVGGMGENAARFLRMLPDFCRYYLGRLSSPGKRYDDVEQLGALLIDRYTGVRQEQVILCLFDNSHRLISEQVIHDGSVNNAQVATRDLVESSIDPQASYALIAHNHPDGIAVPSKEDLETTVRLRDIFDSLGVPLVEHLLVGGDSFMPLLYLEEGQKRITDRKSLITSRINMADFYLVSEEEAEREIGLPDVLWAADKDENESGAPDGTEDENDLFDAAMEDRCAAMEGTESDL